MAEYVPIRGQAGNRIALARIDSLVSAKLGPARVRGNAQPAALNRQVAMYLSATPLSGSRRSAIPMRKLRDSCRP